VEGHSDLTVIMNVSHSEQQQNVISDHVLQQRWVFRSIQSLCAKHFCW